MEALKNLRTKEQVTALRSSKDMATSNAS
jgi:hypothetical protein